MTDPTDPAAQDTQDVAADQQAPDAEAEEQGQYTFYSDEGALVRQADPTSMPELFKPSTQTWVRFPDFDQVHNGFRLDEQAAAEMAGGADVLNAPLDQSAPPVTDDTEGGDGDGQEAPGTQVPPEAGQAGDGGPAAKQGPAGAKQTG